MASIVRDVFKALEYLHSEDIIHSNIKVTFNCDFFQENPKLQATNNQIQNKVFTGFITNYRANFQPENLLSSNDSEFAPTLLADFYMSSLMSHGVLMNSVCGNPSYVGMWYLNTFN